MGLFEKVFGTHSDRELKTIRPIVNKIENLRPTMQAMSDEELRAQIKGSGIGTSATRAEILKKLIKII